MPEPAKFTAVWLRTTPKSRDMRLAYTDRGTLHVAAGDLVFIGRKQTLTIGRVASISMGLQGADWVNQWVKLDYISTTGDRHTAYFADGRFAGWGGLLGGTRRMFQMLKSLATAAA